MNMLVCNVGSTSLKFKLIDMPNEIVLIESKIERINENVPALFVYKDCKGFQIEGENAFIDSYSSGIQLFLDTMLKNSAYLVSNVEDIQCVCFKTVLAKGYSGTHEITDDVMKAVEYFIPVAPAHNIPYISAIKDFQALIPTAIFIGSFETDYHSSIPEYRRIYGIPFQWTENYGLKKMGYHGASHSYVSSYLKENHNIDRKIVSCHLGGSSSLCAIDYGKSVDSSFGFSPQSGIIHSHRVGDLEPAIIDFLVKQGFSFQEIMKELSTHGGLDGISGGIGDYRLLMEAISAGNERARLAFDVFCNDILRYIGMFLIELEGIESIAFTGGIGEHSPEIRATICERLSFLGVELDSFLNNRENASGIISKPDSKIRIFVIPANEELMVARKSYDYIISMN